MSATFELTPWARAALLEDEARAAELGRRVIAAGAKVHIGGRTAGGPWNVRLLTRGRALQFFGSRLHDLLAFALDRFEAGADDAGIRWLAGADGRAHGQPARGRAVWTLCHRPALDERFKHPATSSCSDCWRALDRRVAVA